MTDPGTSAASGDAAIVVLGSVNMDLVVTTPTLPRPGQTLLGRTFQTVCGGKGANQAIAAARSGGRVRFVGAVGDDAFGGQLAANLGGNGVDTAALRTVDGPSGIAAITVDDAAENSIVVVPGANAAMAELTVAEQQLLTDASIVVCQLEIPLSTVVHAGAVAAAAGKPFLLNPSPMQPLSWALLSNTTVLVLNEHEAAEVGADAVDDVFHVVTTLGRHGARYRGPDGEVFTVPAPEVEAVDTTGAGDAFTGALAVAWVEGRRPLEALQFACAAGALATTTPGASVSSPTRQAIEELVARTY
ncbi:ribokinase [Nakamurella deserti]|uniref:ribokinase n=1 Tax=Nakamurella deserti TaxID=2164074 RepID=UPI000DBE2B4E|nr:ribokinase [Nakamurella deserti]